MGDKAEDEGEGLSCKGRRHVVEVREQVGQAAEPFHPACEQREQEIADIDDDEDQAEIALKVGVTARSSLELVLGPMLTRLLKPSCNVAPNGQSAPPHGSRYPLPSANRRAMNSFIVFIWSGEKVFFPRKPGRLIL